MFKMHNEYTHCLNSIKNVDDLTFNSVRSNDINPKFKPENSAEKHKHPTMMMMANQSGTIISLLVIRNHGSVPW